MNRETITQATDQDDVPGKAISPEQLLVQAFQSFEAELLGTMYHVLGNIEDARDACQEAFVRCWNHKDSLHEIQNIRGWVFRIAYNISFDMCKSVWRKRRQPLGDSKAFLTTADQPPDSKMLQTEELRQIREAIQSLEPGERDVFLLRQNGEMSFEQVALTLDIPLGTAKGRMRRAVMKLHGIVGRARD
ncbi:MAG: sigma-70 family RNA polymerase sigma factor [Planctomycetaceae bacterium]|nr:sigma-70 family RNA polymerase sigma factor [Planctomycetaceae bacterium]